MFNHRGATRDAYNMSELLRYKVRIKEWEKDFTAKNGRGPSKADVKANKDIRLAYKIYNELKKPADARKPISDPGTAGETRGKNLDKTAKPHSRTPGHQARPQAVQDPPALLPESSFDAVFTDDEEVQASPVHNAELGPTPQANGKVLSLLDMVLSPPQSSPLKAGNTALSAKNDVFRTPTKAPRHLDASALTPARGTSLSEKLRMASSPSADTVETPFYLGKVNSKFSFSERDTPENSPVKKGKPSSFGSASLAAASPPKLSFQTPEKPPVNFQVSPSPLKPQRFLSFGGAKRASDIFQEFQNIAKNEEFEAQKREFEAEFELSNVNSKVEEEAPQEQAPSRKRKALTQKRTTRNWKIKPRAEDGASAGFESKDVHEEMKKIDIEQRSALEKYMGSGSSGEEASEDETLPVVHKNPNKKRAALSNNYQRLKINDPRAKKFKQRMRRR